MGRPLTYDHLVSKKKPFTKQVQVVMDPDLAEEHETLRRDRDVAAVRAEASPDDAELAFRLLEADQALASLRGRLDDEDAIVTFTFRGIGRPAYDKLVGEHPPTAEQRAKAKAGGIGTLLWNHETFPPAVIAASLVTPALAPDEVDRIWNDPDWNEAELGALLAGAMEANSSRRTVDLGKDSRRTPPSAAKSPTA